MSSIFVYYKPVILEEHMLYSSEIANIYGLTLPNGNPRTRLVTNVIRKYIHENLTDPTYVSYYYETRHGLREVYPEGLYKPAIEAYIKEEEQNV